MRILFKGRTMARIIYGVQGEGRGHSSRSRIIIEELLRRGHTVKIFTSNKGYEYLHQHFPDVIAIMGLSFVFDGDRVDLLKTLRKNLRDGASEAGKTIKALYDGLWDFRPDLSITDFEPFVPSAAGLDNIPFISINHQHVISHFRVEYPHAWRRDYLNARAVIDNMHWFADRYFVTSFYFPPVRRRHAKRSRLIGPILRQEVLEQKPITGEHIVIYATTDEARQALELAARTDAECIAYGFGRAGQAGNIVFKEPSTQGFLKDVATAKAIIANGGYTLMSEALHLGKPYYAIPIGKQFEQMVNGYYLEKLGYGLYDLCPKQQRLGMFLDGLDYFRKNIARDREHFCSNATFFDALAEEIQLLTS